MNKEELKKLRDLVSKDTHGPTIAWDKGTPTYVVTYGPKIFYVRNLNTWCEFYEVNYQMLLRTLREGDGTGTYKGIKVAKLTAE